ncbi:MAG: AIM24 family protein [Eubacterium sp.]|nr:AIM24 family protein [Eubacterium sp.]
MFTTNFDIGEDVRKVIPGKGCFSVLEYERDVSTDPGSAMTAYFASKMNVKKRQVVAKLENSSVIIQAGAMQMLLGDVNVKTDVKGAGDLMKKLIGSKVTGETAIKPRYTGTGVVVMEPTYKYILFEDLADWNGSIVIEDGMFLACEDTVDMKVAARSSFSSAVLGSEGLFNTSLVGSGVAALESPVPQQELIEITLNDDVVKIDGNQAIAWSGSLKFTVEKMTGSFVGSAASGEGFVNVYRGTGKILIAPVRYNGGIVSAAGGNTGNYSGAAGVTGK